VTAWQELLSEELRVATGGRGVAANQPALKELLAAANVRGMTPQEQPVFKALAVYIDPPEYLVDLDHPDGDAFPDPESGAVVLTVRVRGAKTFRWLKNSVAMKENADGGRITGVEGPTLTFKSIVGRDVDQKVWCEATNKWGTTKSKVVHLRLPDEKRAAPKHIENDVQLSYAAQDKLKQATMRDLTKATHLGSLKDMDKLLEEKPLLKAQVSISDGLKAHSGTL